MAGACPQCTRDRCDRCIDTTCACCGRRELASFDDGDEDQYEWVVL